MCLPFGKDAVLAFYKGKRNGKSSHPDLLSGCVCVRASMKVKRKCENVRNARKLFIGVNIRVALERQQPIGSSWRNEWDFG